MHDYMRTVRRGLGLAPALLLMGALAGPAWAVDGVIEINQARALKGGVTTGDEPGFPVTITQPGSYRLTGNLTVPDANTTAIQITTDNVSIDLNGFAIFGPGVSGDGSGVWAMSDQMNQIRAKNITVRNGTVAGMGRHGIYVGQDSRVERVHVTRNGVNGIDIESGIVSNNTVTANGFAGILSDTCTITGNSVQDNGSFGIACKIGTIAGNTVRGNDGTGIKSSRSTVSGNMVLLNGGPSNPNGIMVQSGTVIGNESSGNVGYGLAAESLVGYANNVFSGNGTAPVSGGIQIGPNVCHAILSSVVALCP